MEKPIIKKAEKYLIGGIDSIVSFIAKELQYSDSNSIKKQFLKGDLIRLKKFNNVDSSAVPHILSSIASSLEIANSEYWTTFEHTPFTPYYNLDLKVCCINFIRQSTISEDEKNEMIQAINSFEIEVYTSELLREIFVEETIPEMHGLIPYVEDITIELELRLSVLNQHINLINKAIIKNDEILRNRIKPHFKECATIINMFLKDLLKKINDKLAHYIGLSQTVFNNVLDTKAAKLDLLSYLLENQQKLDKYISYENALIQRGYISQEGNLWLKTPKLFVAFYLYCEMNNLFKTNLKGNSKGIKKLREIYSFQDGKTIDKPAKRKLITRNYITGEYFFLNA